MSSNLYRQPITVVAVALLMIGVVALSGVAVADDHVDDTVEVTEGDEPDIRYSTVIGLYGDGFNEQPPNQYLLEAINLDETDYDRDTIEDMTLGANVIADSGISEENLTVNESQELGVVVNTALFNQFVVAAEADPLVDPRGSYLLRQPIDSADLSASDQNPEAPNSIDVAIDSFTLDSGVATVEAVTNANQVQESSYEWSIGLRSAESVTEDGTFAGSEALKILDASQYENVNYEGLDGIYQLENTAQSPTFYPGSLDVTAGQLSVSDLNLRPLAGQVELDTGLNPIPVSEELGVGYTDVDTTVTATDQFTGQITEGQDLDLSNGHIQIDNEYFESTNIEDTSISAILDTDRSVDVEYDGTAEGTTIQAVRAGPNGTSSEPSIDKEYDVDEDGQSNTLLLPDENIILDSIQIIDNNGSVSITDVNITDANSADTPQVRIEFDETDLTDGNLKNPDRFRVDYEYVQPNPEGEVTQRVSEKLVQPSETVESGDIQQITGRPIIATVVDKELQTDQFNFTLVDNSIQAEENLVSLGVGEDVEFTWGPTNQGPSVGEIQFQRQIENIQEVIGEDVSQEQAFSRINIAGDPANPFFRLGFELNADQRLTFSYTYYDNVRTGVTETLVSDTELGPSGLYEVNDPRTAEFGTMSLQDATADGFNPTVETGDDFVVRITEQESFSSLSGGDVDLREYTYSIGNESVGPLNVSDSGVSANGDETTLEYALQHDNTQVDHEFTISADTEAGVVTDSVVLDSEIPSGRSLPDSGLNTIVVDRAELSEEMDYVIQVLNGSEVIGQREIQDGTNYDNLRITELTEDMSQLEGQELTVRMMRYAALDSSRELVPVYEETVESDGTVSLAGPVESTFTIDSQNGTSEFGSEESGDVGQSVTSLRWTLSEQFRPGELNSEDQRVFLDRLNTNEEPRGPLNIPTGSELLVAGNEFEPGDELVLQPAGDENETFTVSLNVEESDTVNENQIVIDTELPQADVEDLVGRYEVRDPQSGDVVFTYETTEQSLDASVDSQIVNLNRDDTLELNISSDLTEYDVLIESPVLSGDELFELFTDAEVQEYDIEVVGDEEQQVRLRGLSERPESIDLAVSLLDEGEFPLDISVVGSTAAASVTFQTQFGPEGTAEFGRPTVTVAQGDRAVIPITLDGTETAEFSFQTEDYDLRNITIDQDPDADEQLALVMDTYRAGGESYRLDDVEFTDVFSVRGGSFVGEYELPPVEGPFARGIYQTQLRVDGEETDIGALRVVDRETRELNTWVLPATAEASVDNIDSSATRQQQVARGDTLIVEMQMSGFNSPELLTNETDPAKLINPHRRAELDDRYETAQEFVDDEVDGVDSVAEANQINLEIEGQKPPNRPPVSMLLENAEDLVTVPTQDPNNGAVYLFIEMNNNTAFSNFDTRIDHVDNMDHLTQYDLQLNFTESYRLVEDDDNPADINQTMTVRERKVFTDLPTQQVDEDSLDVRWRLDQEGNGTQVRGNTYIAPGTDLTAIVRDDIENVTQETPFIEFQDTTVSGNESGDLNTVQATFDLGQLESGRLMKIQFDGINVNREPAIIGEERLPPQITQLIAEQGVYQVGEEVQFDVTIENAENLQYSWTFGDGTESSLADPVHAYDAEGEYEVQLIVENTETGETATATTTVPVNPEPRTAPSIIDIVAPGEVEVGQQVNFGVVAEDDQADAEQLIYQWNFGEGTTGSGTSASNTYAIPGTYEVSVTVSDPEDPSLSVQDSVFIDVVEGNDQPETQTRNLTLNAVDTETGESLSGVQAVIQNASDNSQVRSDIVTNDEGSFVVEDLPEGQYVVRASLQDYEVFNRQVGVVGSDRSVDLRMTPENLDQNESSGGGGPDQPGFTLILAAIGLIAAGGYVVYRRRLS